ncbi:hexokinase [Eremomyces bilateralis CBS 781.70]|uniref:Phosphotransferase n=1 Tax=Eremomyces bilateralis CBS 781.70 TaxID=1392243 RepID=A0A6G1FSD0_9PEZI|nr:hexokinase [Eremomyces bilateralis CBS 781.70]KAF1808589.1 hexokinase [Eremomyces bilateralis CBS 781.70]
MSLAEAAKRVAAEFEYPAVEVNRGVKEFLKEMEEGLEKDGTSLSQIPTYVTAVPDGTEKGLYMAVDLGGTNFRVCSIRLHGNSTFSLTQSKIPIPQSLMTAPAAHDLFAFLAQQIGLFLEEHHGEHYEGVRSCKSASGAPGYKNEEIFNLGFTFSFPVQQSGINRGTLIRWTKGFDIPDAIGKDVCKLLQDEIDALHLPVRVAALVNDTVGTLMARSYTAPGKTTTLLGSIFGTGTNGAYVERLDAVKKLVAKKDTSGYDPSTGLMIVNTEWGSFDNALTVLPDTPYDRALDAGSVNPGIQMFEKRVSGMFLGEILRRALVAMIADPEVALFASAHSGTNELSSTTSIYKGSKLLETWGVGSDFLSVCQTDDSAGHGSIRQTLVNQYGLHAPSAGDAAAVKTVAAAVGRRAARLAAVAIAGVVLKSGRLEGTDEIDVGVDGSLVEFYPGFVEEIRAALDEVEGVGEEGERRIRIGIAKDGSGVGAALIALVAGRLGES